MTDHVHLTEGNAYRVEDGAMMTAARLADGSVDENWSEVDWDRIDEREAEALRRIARSLA